MFDSNDTKHPKGTILVDYEVLLDELIDETRELLLKKKKENKKVKEKNSDLLFDEFIYVNSLRNAATMEQEYKEAYETLTESIQNFRGQSAG